MIHSTAIVSEKALIGKNAHIGPYCVIDDDVRIGDNCHLEGNVAVHNGSVLGDNFHAENFVSVGGSPQDLNFDRSLKTGVVVGNNCTFHEGVTVHRATQVGAPTRMGDNCMLMANSHVAHDCVVGSHVIFANGALIGGHVHIDDYVFISGNSVVHQGCHLGEGVMLSGNSCTSMDIPPYCNAASRNTLHGLNLIGMRRRKFDTGTIRQIKNYYFKVFGVVGSPAKYAQTELDKNEELSEPARKFLQFFVEKRHGILRPTHQSHRTDESPA